MKTKTFTPLLLGATVLLLQACASPDRVVFVTNTQFDIGYDASSGTANIGYNRDEDVIGPAYPETGGVPPVYAHLKNTGNLLSPKVKQLYATGDAARRATSLEDCPAAENRPLTGDRRLMFFGTSTNFGLKVKFVETLPESVNFGFKRKEFSWLPLRKAASGSQSRDGEDEYGSLLAYVAVGTDTSADGTQSVSYDIEQLIATGDAANNLACMDDIRLAVRADAATAFEDMQKARANIGSGHEIPGQ